MLWGGYVTRKALWDRPLLALTRGFVANFRQVGNLSNPSFLSDLIIMARSLPTQGRCVQGSVRSATQNESGWRTIPTFSSDFHTGLRNPSIMRGEMCGGGDGGWGEGETLKQLGNMDCGEPDPETN